jgi:hypothetical protein
MELQAPREAPEPPEPSVDLPLTPLAAVPHIAPDIPESVEVPDPAVVAAISHLEQFLAAIQHARRA